MSKQPASMSLTVAARGVYDFKVEDYSFIAEMAGPCKSFQSDTLSVGGYNWAVRLKPARSGLPIYLVILSQPKGHVGVSFACTLLDKSGEPSAATERRVCKTFLFPGQHEGFKNFMSAEDLGKFLHGDCLGVRCIISVHKKPIF